MRASYQKHIVVAALVAAAVVAAFGALFFLVYVWPGVSLLGKTAPEYVVLDSVQLGKQPVEFYVNYEYDSAVLGFSLESPSGERRFFPMYCSTYRGMPSVTLDVYFSDTQEEMWVLSSWKGYEQLAYYRVGSERGTTGDGQDSFFDVPTPKIFYGGSSVFPEMDPSRVRKIRKITHVKK